MDSVSLIMSLLGLQAGERSKAARALADELLGDATETSTLWNPNLVGLVNDADAAATAAERAAKQAKVVLGISVSMTAAG